MPNDTDDMKILRYKMNKEISIDDPIKETSLQLIDQTKVS